MLCAGELEEALAEKEAQRANAQRATVDLRRQLADLEAQARSWRARAAAAGDRSTRRRAGSVLGGLSAGGEGGSTPILELGEASRLGERGVASLVAEMRQAMLQQMPRVLDTFRRLDTDGSGHISL